ncbi:MAG: galactose-1-phosphate uridylyltransferase [Oscillospiraceae bacterium]
MAELRYNPINREWVMVASHRQNRPNMPEHWCPFCPGSGRVPDEGFEVLRYLNDFPALSQMPPVPDDVATDLFRTRPAYGRCEVLLYSDRHDALLRDLSDEHVHKLARLWLDCFNELAADEQIKYVYLFENRGEAVGVTMPHPHGQAYGYSFVPKKLEQEIVSAREHYAATGRCLFCKLLTEEKKVGQRILFSNAGFTAFVPFFSPITYGVQVMANRHMSTLAEMTEAEINFLGEIVRDCAGMFDNLFGTAFPYMMCMHNAPVNGQDCAAFYHFHIEFFPPMRSADKQQFFAASEMGAGAWCNPNDPEQKADELRAAYQKFCASKKG